MRMGDTDTYPMVHCLKNMQHVALRRLPCSLLSCHTRSTTGALLHKRQLPAQACAITASSTRLNAAAGRQQAAMATVAAPGSKVAVTPEQRQQIISDSIRGIPDFPKPGILFWDVTTLLLNPTAFQMTIDALYDRYKDQKIDAVAGWRWTS